MTIQLEYINYLLQFSKIFPIMLALCLMLSLTYYAQNYAGIIGWSLPVAVAFVTRCFVMIYSVILRLLHVSSSNATKTTLHHALANDGHSRSKQIVSVL